MIVVLLDFLVIVFKAEVAEWCVFLVNVVQLCVEESLAKFELCKVVSIVAVNVFGVWPYFL